MYNLPDIIIYGVIFSMFIFTVMFHGTTFEHTHLYQSPGVYIVLLGFIIELGMIYLVNRDYRVN